MVTHSVSRAALVHPESLLKTRKKLLTAVIASALVAGCSGGGGGGAANGSASTKIDLSGGTGGSNVEGLDRLSRSGSGGSLEIIHEAGGDILIYDKAPEYTPPAPYEQIDDVTPEFGDQPLRVTEDTTIPYLADEPEEGIAYLTNADEDQDGIFISDGDGTAGEEEERVTGLHVAKGATLRFEAMAEFSGLIDVDMTNDFELAGRLESTALSTRIDADNILGRRSGEVDLQGVESNPRGRSIFLTAASNFVNAATFDTSGVSGSGGEAGDAGWIFFTTSSENPEHALENVGELTANGGDRSAAGGEGGEGGFIRFSARDTTLFNAGEIISDGGANLGDGGVAGKGGIIHFQGESSLYSTGDLQARGGEGAEGGEGGRITWETVQRDGAVVYARKNKLNTDGGLALDGDGGEGGEGGVIRIASTGTPLYLNGEFSSRGGDSASLSIDAAGGQGGELVIRTDASNLDGTTAAIVLSGPVDLSGGNVHPDTAAAGGWGGYLGVTLDDADDITVQNDIVLVYDALIATGGTGIPGGNGGSFEAINIDSDDSVEISGGKIVNEMDINVSGGDLLSTTGLTTSAVGGDMGNITFYAENLSDSFAQELEKSILNTGKLLADSGDGFDQNSVRLADDSYNISFTAYQDIRNDGPISSNGSNDVSSSDTGRGWSAGYVTMESASGEVVNNGKVSLKGGSGSLNGGSGGEFFVNIATDSTATMKGKIVATGGNADRGLEGSQGGNGGMVWAISYFDDTFSELDNRVGFNNKNVDPEAGTGQNEGLIGCIIDGVYILAGGEETCPDDEDLYDVIAPVPEEGP